MSAGSTAPREADSPDARLEQRLGAFGARLALQRPPLCPELELWLMSGDVDLEAGCRELAQGEAPPYWAFCWGSGQALARFVLDHPEWVRDRRVVDLGTGSGVAAIAAARAGARSVLAVDLDPTARQAALLNAARNGVVLATAEVVPESFDLLLAADVLYETGLRDFVFEVALRRGPCLLADPRRTGTPPVDFPVLARFDACTLPDVDSPRKQVFLHALPRREASSLR